jgi:hypothetical protein
LQTWGTGTSRGKKAGDGTRTHDNHVGNVVLYQLSYTRMVPRRMRIMPVRAGASSDPALVAVLFTISDAVSLSIRPSSPDPEPMLPFCNISDEMLVRGVTHVHD